MKKEEIRKEFFKLRIKNHSYNQCRKIIKAMFKYEVTSRTLQRWDERLRKTEWNLRDDSRRPKTIHRKVTLDDKNKIISIRNKTGWCAEKIKNFVDLSHTTINKVLQENNLTNQSYRSKKRLKYIRWQRKHPNSLWQMDVSYQKVKEKYCFAVIDDCSRFNVGIRDLNRVTTSVVTQILDELILIHGKPREILTDNGPPFGGKSKHSKFDRWCRRRGIKHIRTAIHSPTTTGKIERFFQTLNRELKFCRDLEDFRMRYNHFRPHISLGNKSPQEIYFKFSRLF